MTLVGRDGRGTATGPTDAEIGAHRNLAIWDVFPHAFERLRTPDPVSWWEEPTPPDSGAVTRDDDLLTDLLTVSKNPELFSNPAGMRMEEMDPSHFGARRNMLEYDPPKHTRYRRLVSKPFSRREVWAYENAIRLLARSVRDEVLPSGTTKTIDFTEDTAKQLPMRILGRLLGVPDRDGPWLLERGDPLLGNFDPEMTEHPVGLVDAEEINAMPFRSPAGLDLYRYAPTQVARRRTSSSDDVISDLLAHNRRRAG